MQTHALRSVPMAQSNATVARILREYAAALALAGENRFKVKAYRRAAETIDSLEGDLARLLKTGFELESLPGIGAAIAGAIREIVETGELKTLGAATARLSP